MVMNAVDVEVERLLVAGKESARTGDVAQARSYLAQVVERDPQNEQAWMWLSGVVTEPEEQQICLENVLVINPYNTKARKGLEFLSVKTGVAPHAPPVPTEFTAPLTDLSSYGDVPQPQAHNAPPPTMPPSDMSLPPWMQNGSAAHVPVSPAADPGLSLAHDNGFAHDAAPFAPPSSSASPAANNAAALPNDPWGGRNVSANSLDIDWSKGLDAEPAAPQSNSFGTGQFGSADPQAWGSMDMFGRANDASNGVYNAQPPDGSMPGWSLDDGQGLEVIRAGTLGAEQQDMGGYSPMGPSGDFQLPQPSDLPGYNASMQTEAKPWYAQSSSSTGMLPQNPTGILAGMDLNGDQHTQHLPGGRMKPAVMVACPNCHEQVADTALACPHCNFGFFINCPHCHELVDTIDAKTGETEPCPYCGTEIEKMKLGMTNADSNSPYLSQKPVKMEAPIPAMQHYTATAAAHRGFSWGWVVDLMWLAAVVILVWAFTQLPVWLHLTGQYQ